MKTIHIIWILWLVDLLLWSYFQILRLGGIHYNAYKFDERKKMINNLNLYKVIYKNEQYTYELYIWPR